MSGGDSEAEHRRRVVEIRGRSCQVLAQTNIIILPTGMGDPRSALALCVDIPSNPVERLRDAMRTRAIVTAPDVPAVWCLATYAAVVERLGADCIEKLVVRLRDECASLRGDLSARSHLLLSDLSPDDLQAIVSDSIGHRAHHVATAAGLLGFERLARQSTASPTGAPGGPVSGWCNYLDRALAVAIHAIDAHCVLAAA